MPALIALLVVLCIGAAFGLRSWTRRQRRNRLLQASLTDAQRQILLDQVPLIARLPAALRPKLEGKITLFLDQVTMHGYEGIEVTEEMQLSIAGQACLLIVNSDAWYKTLRTVLIYPAAFKSVQTIQDGFVVKQEEVVRLGESWAHGPVILSWRDSHQGALNDTDGKNVVLHEFAHPLDALSGYTDGVPILNRTQSFAEWETVFLAAFARHQNSVSQRSQTTLDPYGAQNHQEFLAVAVEAFFERPIPLRESEPALYAQLTILLQIDPATWG